MIKVAILGSTGMLGSMVHRYLSRQPRYKLTNYSRGILLADAINSTGLTRLLIGQDYVLNCIGVIKSRIDEQNPQSVECAVQVNSLFPHRLARAAEQTGCRVLQIATDCVYSGREGGYLEFSPHDPLDIYGKTKSLGEVSSPAVRHLRCSIIGPEQAGRPKDSLLEWFLGQPRRATVKGYTNHWWNGITTLHFAKICHAIMTGRVHNFPVRHLVPANKISKYELLHLFARTYHREDIKIEEITMPIAVDRTLSTLDLQSNWRLWQAATHASLPTIQQMVKELAVYSRSAEEVSVQ